MSDASTGEPAVEARRPESSDGALPSRSELESAVTLKQEKIGRELKALREELRHIPARQFIRDHPVKTTVAAAVVGLGLSRWLLTRLGWRELSPEEYREQLLDDLLATIIEESAHSVAIGATTQDALRESVRRHTPIVFEVERESQDEGESVAAAAVHTLFALAQPYLQRYLRSKVERFRPSANE